MANRICPVIINCPCDDKGLQNTNSEDPDPLIFTGIGYTPAMTYRPQTLGQIDSSAIAQDCYGTAFSVASQEIADLIAEANAIACVNNGEGAGGAPLDPTPTGTTPTVPIPPGVPTPPPTKGRNILKGGGGGGGGGGEPRTSPFNPGSRPTSILPLHHWSCPQDTLVPEENVYTLLTSRAGVQYDFRISKGALPDGITLGTISLNSAALGGSAQFADPGLYSFTVQATFAGTQPGTTFVAGSVDDTYEVYGLTNNGSVPIIPRNVQFSYQLTAYGQAPLSWYIVEDDFPPGITMDASGLISGKVTDAECGKSYFPIVGYTDAKGRGCASEVPIVIEGMVFTNGDIPPIAQCASMTPFQFTTNPSGAVFTLIDGPDCLVVSSDGWLSGKMVEPVGIVYVHAEMPDNPACSADASFELTVTGVVDTNCASTIGELVWLGNVHGPGKIFSSGPGFVKMTISSIQCDGDCCYAGNDSGTVLCYLNNPCGAPYDIDVEVIASVSAGRCVTKDHMNVDGSGHVQVSSDQFSNSDFVNLNGNYIGGGASTHYVRTVASNPPHGFGTFPTTAACGLSFLSFHMDCQGPAGCAVEIRIAPITPPGLCP